MWDDLKIGDGDTLSVAEHVKIQGAEPFGISKNRTSFWISNAFLGAGIRVMRNTDEGQLLSRLIADERPTQAFETALAAMVIKHMPTQGLILLAKRALGRAETRGAREAQASMRRSMGIET